MARVVAFIAMFLMLSAIVVAEVNCPNVIGQLLPCESYLEGQGGDKPPSNCCNGVKQIYNLALNQRSDRVDICNCIQPELLRRRGSIIEANVVGLPDACEVSFKLPPMDPNYDCSTIG